MSERIRHAAELGVRLLANLERDNRLYGVQFDQSPGQIALDVDKLLRLSASLRGIHERQCNGTMPDCRFCHKGAIAPGQECPECDGDGTDHKREKRLVRVVTDTLKPYGLTWEHNSDPRGSAVGILFPDGAYNTMGGKESGWRV